MSTRASIAGHPIHPMLVTIPIGLWIFSLVCDFGFVITGDSAWAITAYYTLGGGIDPGQQIRRECHADRRSDRGAPAGGGGARRRGGPAAIPGPPFRVVHSPARLHNMSRVSAERTSR